MAPAWTRTLDPTGGAHGDQAASLLALGDVTGSNVSAGDVAALYAFGAAADVIVSGVDGAVLFAYANLLGTVNSSAGWAEAFSGGNAIVVSISAATDASVTALGDLEALRVSAGGNANLFAGGDLEAVASAGGNLYSTSYGDTDASYTAGGDAMVFSLGQMTANVTAGNDAWAAAWDDMQIDIAAGHDVRLVWTFGDLTGSTVTAGNHIGRVKSYGSIDAAIAAGDLPVDDPLRDANYGRIDVVEAWGSIDGSITAEGGDGLIVTVRSGASVDATLSPSPTLLAENDRNVFGPIPSPDVPSLAPVRASLAGMYRQLQQGQAGALAAKGGMTLQKNALVASLRQQLKSEDADDRAIRAYFANCGFKLAAEIQAAEQAVEEALQKDHNAYVNAQKLTAAGWNAGVAAAEALKHSAEMKLAVAAADFGLARDVAINAATQLQIAVTLARSEQMAQLNEAIAQRPEEWKEAHANDPAVYSESAWDYLWSDDPYYESLYWNWVKAPWRGPSKTWGDKLLIGGKFLGWGMAIGAGSVLAAKAGLIGSANLLAAHRLFYTDLLYGAHSKTALWGLVGYSSGLAAGLLVDESSITSGGFATAGGLMELGAISRAFRYQI